jgi:oligoribonuclease
MLAIFLDIEATGLDPVQHHAIDIAFKVVDVKSGTLIAAYQSIVRHPFAVWQQRDPVSIEVNGYTWEDVSQGQEPEVVSQQIIHLFNSIPIVRGQSVFICQNPAFDRNFFSHFVDIYTQEKFHWPYHWLDLASMYWSTKVQAAIKQGLPFPDKINLSKNTIAKEYHLAPEVDPHRAVNGVDHLILCYQAVLGVDFNLDLSPQLEAPS